MSKQVYSEVRTRRIKVLPGAVKRTGSGVATIYVDMSLIDEVIYRAMFNKRARAKSGPITVQITDRSFEDTELGYGAV